MSYTFDQKMMALALAEARKAWGRTSPNPMVGAVVVKNGRVVGKGYHPRAGEAHAEPRALAAAGDQARGSDLYVTLEPCRHHGRTPPCTEAILEAGISRVVIGCRDPNPNVAGGGADFLISRGLKVETGVLEERCQSLIEFFVKHVRTGRPFVILKTAATLDGKIATTSGHSRWVTGEKARAYVHHLRDGVDAILVGKGTVDQDDPALSTRLPGKKIGRDPVRIVLDTNLSLSPSARVFDQAIGGPSVVACGPGPAKTKVKALEKRGVQVWPLKLHQGRVSLAGLMDRLGREDIISVLVEGGAEINSAALLEEKVVDRVLFFYAPKIVGGRLAPTLTGGAGVQTMGEALNLDITRVRRLGPDLLVEAKPVY